MFSDGDKAARQAPRRAREARRRVVFTPPQAESVPEQSLHLAADTVGDRHAGILQRARRSCP